MGVRRFRDEFPSLTESVRVIRSTRKGDKPQEILGVWTPERRAYVIPDDLPPTNPPDSNVKREAATVGDGTHRSTE